MAGVGLGGPGGAGWVETVLLLSPNHRCCPHAGAAGAGSFAGAEGPPLAPQLQVLDRLSATVSCFSLPAVSQAMRAQASPTCAQEARKGVLAVMKIRCLGQPFSEPLLGTQDPRVCWLGWGRQLPSKQPPGLQSGSWRGVGAALGSPCHSVCACVLSHFSRI